MKIRQVDPGAAWNEAQRRAIPFGFIGFFVAGLICVFGYTPGIRDPSLAGVCGAIGLFVANIAFVVGFYSKKFAFTVVAVPLATLIPTAITALLLRWMGNGRVGFVPSVIAGIVMYFSLHCAHRTLSGTTVTTYVQQLADDQSGTPEAGWERKLFWLLVALGAAIVFGLLTKR